MPGQKLSYPGRNYLFASGPTHIPTVVQNAMNVPMEDHRAPDFPELVKPILRDLKKVFLTKTGTPFIFPATGTAGWEVALANTLSPGDKILTSRFGQFSHLWYDLAKRIGLEVELIDTKWGNGIEIEKFKKALAKDKDKKIKAVVVCHNETATGVTSDIEGLRKAMDQVKHPALLMVDGVSSIASVPFRFDKWKIDIAVSGSQKGFMLPAGLAILCFSKKALAMRKTAKCKRCFLDIQDHLNTNKDGFFPYTPPVNLLRGLRVAIDLLLEEGMENVFYRHNRLASGVRAAIKAWGLRLAASSPKWQSDTVSAIWLEPGSKNNPDGKKAIEVINIAYHRYNISLGAGLTQVAGKVFRIGHLGDNNEARMMAALGGVEMAMIDAGIKFTPGSGTGAAAKYWTSNPDKTKKKKKKK